MFNKIMGITIGTFLSLTSSFAETQCPPSRGDGTLSFEKNFLYPELRIASNLILKEERTGDTFFSYSKEKVSVDAVYGKVLLGKFRNEKNEIEELPIGTILSPLRPDPKKPGICYDFNLSPEVTVAEIVRKVKTDCSPLPSWLCGKDKVHQVVFAHKYNNEVYTLSALTMVTE